MTDSGIITFDCYGTLIDWESGIRNAFKKALSKSGAKPELETEALRLYETEEARIENEQPHQLYKDVLSETTKAIAKKIGWNLPDADATFLAEALPRWTPFPDTNPALESLARKYTLGILSNVDNILLAGTLKHLKPRFEILVTAENVKSYKPKQAHFIEARRLVGDRAWVHVAGSFYHDIEPAVGMGIRAVWVNRKGATPPHRYSERQVFEAKDLNQVADWFEARL